VTSNDSGKSKGYTASITWCLGKFDGFLVGGNSNIFGIFTPKIGEDEPNLTFAYFSNWVGSTTNQFLFGESLGGFSDFSPNERPPARLRSEGALLAEAERFAEVLGGGG